MYFGSPRDNLNRRLVRLLHGNSGYWQLESCQFWIWPQPHPHCWFLSIQDKVSQRGLKWHQPMTKSKHFSTSATSWVSFLSDTNFFSMNIWKLEAEAASSKSFWPAGIVTRHKIFRIKIKANHLFSLFSLTLSQRNKFGVLTWERILQFCSIRKKSWNDHFEN